MSRLVSGFRSVNVIRKDRPLTNDEIFRHVPSIFSEGKHDSRSDRYTYIPTISILDRLRNEGFEPFFACQARVRDQDRKGHAKHMLRLRRSGQISGQEVPEIILLNSHDGSSSYQMIPGVFRFVCHNGMVCGDTFGEIRVPHKGEIVDRVIEGAYEVLDRFDAVSESRDEMKSIILNRDEQRIFAETALEYRYENQHNPLSPERVLQSRRREDDSNDIWTVYQRTQENIIKGGLMGINKKGRPVKTRGINGIDGDIKTNRVLWSLAEKMKELKG